MIPVLSPAAQNMQETQINICEKDKHRRERLMNGNEETSFSGTREIWSEQPELLFERTNEVTYADITMMKGKESLQPRELYRSQDDIAHSISGEPTSNGWGWELN